MKKILAYLRSRETRSAFRTFCNAHNAEAVFALGGELNKPAAALLGIPVFPGMNTGAPVSGTGDGIVCEVLLFSGFDRKELDPFLDALRLENLCTDIPKAVLTPINSGWTLAELSAALQAEKSAIRTDRR